MTDAPQTTPQRTLAREVRIEGVGLFTGQRVNVVFHPAPPDHGVVFRRSDVEDRPLIPARVENVVDTPRRTTIRAPGPGEGESPVVVETVEHCLSALAGLGIDNVLIDLDAPELPIGDGSARFFVEALGQAGLAVQDEPQRPLVVREPVTVRSPAGGGAEAVLVALPNDSPSLELVYDLDYGEGSNLPRQVSAFTLRRGVANASRPGPSGNGSANGSASALKALPSSYASQIAPARTFALLAEAQAMRERGMFAHVSPADLLVIGDDGPVDNEYRFDDEPVRHKLLDLLGDLSLVGRPIQGRIIASRSGHALNHRLAHALLEQALRREKRGEGRAADPAPPALNIRDVLKLLPHRFPMVLVDRVLEIDEDRRAVGIKNVTVNEPFFQGHYPGQPIMPGVLIVEAMSQLAGLMLSQKLERTGKIAVLLSMERVKLRRRVVPGDQLVMETEAIKASERFGDVQCRARVDGRVVAEARIKFMMVDAEQDL